MRISTCWSSSSATSRVPFDSEPSTKVSRLLEAADKRQDSRDGHDDEVCDVVIVDRTHALCFNGVGGTRIDARKPPTGDHHVARRAHTLNKASGGGTWLNTTSLRDRSPPVVRIETLIRIAETWTIGKDSHKIASREGTCRTLFTGRVLPRPASSSCHSEASQTGSSHRRKTMSPCLSRPSVACPDTWLACDAHPRYSCRSH